MTLGESINEAAISSDSELLNTFKQNATLNKHHGYSSNQNFKNSEYKRCNTKKIPMELGTEADKIINGTHVIIQRGDQDRILEFNERDTVKYGKGSNIQEIELKNAQGFPFYTTFRIKPTTIIPLDYNGSLDTNNTKRRRYQLEAIQNQAAPFFSTEGITSGKDNRNIRDDNQSQSLNSTDIALLREKGVSGPEILDNLIAGSKTFEQKTEFAQEKYLKKKERTYGDTLVFLQPTIFSIAEYYYKRDPSRILYVRPDTLSQILSYANVFPGGKFMVYESGCCGLIVASVLHRLGGVGMCFHAHPGSTPQRQAISYLNLKSEEIDVLQNLDIFYLTRPPHVPTSQSLPIETPSEEPEPKKQKLEETAKLSDSESMEVESTDNTNNDGPPVKSTDRIRIPKHPKLLSFTRTENEKSASILESAKFDGLIIVSKEHPLAIVQNLIRYTAPSASFVIYCQYTEPLVQCYTWLKQEGYGLNMNIIENWFRNIQIETDRTHPEISMSSSGGFLLHGTRVTPYTGPQNVKFQRRRKQK